MSRPLLDIVIRIFIRTLRFLFLLLILLIAFDWLQKEITPPTRWMEHILNLISSGNGWNEPALAVLTALYAFREVFDNRDKFGTDPLLKPHEQTGIRNVEGYLNGRLRVHIDEEKRFVKLAGKVTIPTALRIDVDTLEDIDEAVDKFKLGFALVGEPGCGKSTLLRHIERKAIDDYKSDPTKHRWPLWINLGLTSNPVKAKELLDYWWQRHYLPGTPEQHISQNSFWLLLDGFNEMTLDTRKERATSIREFLEKQENPIPVIITCRIDDYENDAGLRLDLPSVYIQELDNPRIREFVKKVHTIQLWNDLEKPENTAILAMARNPYKLTMLVSVYDRRERKLPLNLNQLYSMYVKQTYKEYNEGRSRKFFTSLLQLSWDDLERKLKQLAFRMYTDGNGISLPINTARARVGNQALLDGINMGILKRDGNEILFFHQSLQGYFAIELLVKAINVNTPFERITKDPVGLIRQVGDLGENATSAIPVFIQALEKDSRVYLASVQALTKIGTPAVDPLIEALEDDVWQVRMGAAEALGHIGDDKAVDSLIAALGDDDRKVRIEAIEALQKIGTPAVDSLIAALEDDSPVRKEAAAEILDLMEKAEAVDSLIEALKTDYGQVRIEAIEALQNIGTPAVDSLIAALEDDDRQVRMGAAEALGHIGDDKAVDPLRQALRDDDRQVRSSADTALERILSSRILYVLSRDFFDEIQ